MKILYLCPDTGIDVLGRKGSSIHVREMIAAFHRAGHDVELIAPRLTKPGAPAAVETPATVTRVAVPEDVQQVKHTLDAWVDRFSPSTSLPKDIRRILYDKALVDYLAQRFTTDDAPELIYVRASLLSTAGVALAQQLDRPLIVELNAPLADEQSRYRGGPFATMYQAVERELLLAATAVVVVSEQLVAYVSGLGVDSQRIHVLPNGVDITRFAPAAKFPAAKAPGAHAPASPPTLGFVGGLRAWHGVEHLPEILHLVHQRFPETRLVIAGDGPLRPEIERRATELGVADQVVFLGAVDHEEMPSVIQGFTVALAPYPRLEHDFYFSPLKMFEYLACGVPVVASDVGQISDTVTHRHTAWLSEPGDMQGLADGCISLIADTTLAAELGRNGAAMVRSRYTWDRNAAQVIGLASVEVAA